MAGEWGRGACTRSILNWGRGGEGGERGGGWGRGWVAMPPRFLRAEGRGKSIGSRKARRRRFVVPCSSAAFGCRYDFPPGACSVRAQHPRRRRQSRMVGPPKLALPPPLSRPIMAVAVVSERVRVGVADGGSAGAPPRSPPRSLPHRHRRCRRTTGLLPVQTPPPFPPPPTGQAPPSARVASADAMAAAGCVGHARRGAAVRWHLANDTGIDLMRRPR